MSLAIDPETVVGVLLRDGWHDARKGTFCLDSYEFVEGNEDWRGNSFIYMGGGSVEGIPSLGFSFKEGTNLVSGPITSVLAVKHT